MKRYRFRRASTPGDIRSGISELRALNRASVSQNGEPRIPARTDARRDGEVAPQGAPSTHMRRQRREGKGPNRPRRAAFLGGRGWLGLAWRLSAIVVVAFAVWAYLGYQALQDATTVANRGITTSARRALKPAGGFMSSPENTLVVGADIDPGQTFARADSMMIVRTDPNSGRIKYLSITYDMLVNLPGYGQQKISAAMAYLGQSGIIRAVEVFTGVPINHIVIVNYPGAIKFVNSLGGVTVNNPVALTNCRYPGGTYVSFAKGELHLNGTKALEFARVRQCDSDFERQGRQQLVAQAIKSEVLSLGNLWQAPWIGADAIRSIDTDLSTSDLIELGWQLHSLTASPRDRLVIAGTPAVIGGIDYVVADPSTDHAQLAQFMGPK